MFLDWLAKLMYVQRTNVPGNLRTNSDLTNHVGRRVMKLPSKFTALVCCIVLIVLAGAGTTLRGQTAGFAYVANNNSNNVSAYTIDGATGALTPIPGSPFPAGLYPDSVTVDPTGQFAYVANAGSNNVSAYTIDGTTGALTPVPGSPFAAGVGPISVTTTAGPQPPPATAAKN
jgi:hypothetical protein